MELGSIYLFVRKRGSGKLLRRARLPQPPEDVVSAKGIRRDSGQTFSIFIPSSPHPFHPIFIQPTHSQELLHPFQHAVDKRCTTLLLTRAHFPASPGYPCCAVRQHVVKSRTVRSSCPEQWQRTDTEAARGKSISIPMNARAESEDMPLVVYAMNGSTRVNLR